MIDIRDSDFLEITYINLLHLLFTVWTDRQAFSDCAIWYLTISVKQVKEEFLMVSDKELYYSWLLPYMQKTLSFGRYQATNGRDRRVFISSAGRWEWPLLEWRSPDSRLLSVHVMLLELLQYYDDSLCCCSFHVVRKSVTAAVDVLANQNVWFIQQRPRMVVSSTFHLFS